MRDSFLVKENKKAGIDRRPTPVVLNDSYLYSDIRICPELTSSLIWCISPILMAFRWVRKDRNHRAV